MPERLPSPCETLHAEVEGAIGWLIFDNPARKNALTYAMWQAIPPMIAALDAHPEVRIIVLRGAGSSAFASGADISEFETLRASAAGARAYEEANEVAFDAIAGALKPTVAMIRGFCLGGGLGIAVSTDIRIAADDAIFGIPAGRLGVGYPPPSMRYVVRATSPSIAKELFYTARRVDASEAHALGLLARVVPADMLEHETRAFADLVAENAPLTLQAAKKAIDHVTGMPFAADANEARAFANRCFDSADYAEGRTAFLAKRKPVFSGK